MALVRVTVYLTEELHRLVKAEAARRGMSISAVIREVVAQQMPVRSGNAEPPGGQPPPAT